MIGYANAVAPVAVRSAGSSALALQRSDAVPWSNASRLGPMRRHPVIVAQQLKHNVNEAPMLLARPAVYF